MVGGGLPLGDDPGDARHGDGDAQPGAGAEGLAQQEPGDEAGQGRGQGAQQQGAPRPQVLQRLKIGRIAQADADGAAEQDQAQGQGVYGCQRVAGQQQGCAQQHQGHEALDQVQLAGRNALAGAAVEHGRHGPE